MNDSLLRVNYGDRMAWGRSERIRQSTWHLSIRHRYTFADKRLERAIRHDDWRRIRPTCAVASDPP